MAESAENTRKSLNLEDLKVYEVGYFLVPLIMEADVANEVAKIQFAIEERGGVSISDEFPVMRGLAYPMRKAIGDRNQVFDTGYFGWIKFEIGAENAIVLKEDIAALPNILRFILVRAARENIFLAPKSSILGSRSSGIMEGGETREGETVISDEELDKSIEELIAE